MKAIGFWPLVLEALQALSKQYTREMDETANQAGLKAPLWYLLLPALSFDPGPTTAERLCIRHPYTAPRNYKKRLQTLAEEGYLISVPEDEYYLSEEGRHLTRLIIQSAYSELEVLEPLLLMDLDPLADLLRTLVDACLVADEPPGKWSLHHSRRIDPGERVALIVKIDHYLSDLAAYRDDAHLAAWQPYGLSGQAWEAFTVLWRGEAGSLEEVYKKLERRSYTRGEYAQALQDLVKRGWLRLEQDRFRLTDEGRTVRQVVENQTDKFFYAPWDCLDEGEKQHLHKLLARFRDVLH